MSHFVVAQWMPLASVISSRGSGAGNLGTPDPKEVWADAAAGSAATIAVDLGEVRSIDTIFLGHVRTPSADATWSISCGVGSSDETVVQATTAMRVQDVLGNFAATSHALWRGAAITARYISITLTQPAGLVPLTAGVLLIGKAFVAELGQEWGAGSRPIDTGSATSLASGGFSIVEGVRKRLFTWTFGDLSIVETQQLELLALAVGETGAGMVIEDDQPTQGLRARIFYGKFDRWRAYERRNRSQTRWEIGIEEWV